MSGLTPPADRLDLQPVMRRLSAHLDRLGDQMRVVEQVISEQLSAETRPQSREIIRLQNLDCLRQSLEDLTVLTQLLSRAEGIGKISHFEAAEISAAVNLNDTKALIYPQTMSGECGKAMLSSGDLDLL